MALWIQGASDLPPARWGFLHVYIIGKLLGCAGHHQASLAAAQGQASWVDWRPCADWPPCGPGTFFQLRVPCHPDLPFGATDWKPHPGRKHIPLELGACQGSEGRWFVLTPQLSCASSSRRSACVPVLRAPSAHVQSGIQWPRRKVSPEWLCFRSRVPAHPCAWSRISFERESRPFFFLSLFQKLLIKKSLM